MTTLYDYLGRADDERKALLRKQWNGAQDGAIYCPSCGLYRHLTLAYRCLYCGVWFCADCAGKHFGLSMKDWLDKEKSEGRVGSQDLREPHNC